MTRPSDDIVQPFLIEASGLRGRLVRLGPTLADIVSAHDYPPPVAALLAETVILAGLLSGMLKYEGVFSLQASGDGPVSLLVADVTSKGEMRAYARFAAERLPEKAHELSDLVGKGYMAFTVDQGADVDRYQGIVALDGRDLADCCRHYFRQSEQIETGLVIAAGQTGGVWRGGGMMLQRLPEPHEPGARETEEDGWRRAMVLMGSCKSEELLDPKLDPDILLYRLFHEDGIRVVDPHPLRKACRCSKDRVVGVLRSLPRAEVESLAEDGVVDVACEFCNAHYRFAADDLEAIYAQNAPSS